MVAALIVLCLLWLRVFALVVDFSGIAVRAVVMLCAGGVSTCMFAKVREVLPKPS